MNAVQAYRKAAQKLFQANDVEAEVYIVDPSEDPGQWAPDALAIIYLEADMRREGDQGRIPEALGYWSEGGLGRIASA